MVNTPYQPVSVETRKPQSTCTVASMTFLAPAIVPLARNKDHEISCVTPDGEVSTVRLRRGYSNVWMGNIIFGLVPGLLVDYVTGSLSDLPTPVLVGKSEPMVP